MNKQEAAVRFSKREVTIRFFTVGVPELELKDIIDAITKKR